MFFKLTCFVFIAVLAFTDSRKDVSQRQLHSSQSNLLIRLTDHINQQNKGDSSSLTDSKDNVSKDRPYDLSISKSEKQHQYMIDHLPLSIGYRGDLKGRRIKRSSQKRPRKSRKYKRAFIHVSPKNDNPHVSDVPVEFDPKGNIRCMWQDESRLKMNLFLDSPRGYNEAYIGIKYPGYYFVYGQIFFHGQNVEMGHCLYTSDTYPCKPPKCTETSLLCSRSAPGHPENSKDIENLNTNYIGGIFYLKRGSTIRLGVITKGHGSKVIIDKAMSYFGAFSI
ncbi:unnamed protein product [Owenia fusiformis]|uniref:THD domain-containing protein n=1 Tax=Owenia fusiformis TaxID=6347 RepID=A0A8J1XLN0_OWEFU|nr:unnamed protein product [Owenia fusiformis]